MTLPNENITPIPAIDPITGEAPDATPELWNTRYSEIDENFADISQKVEANQASLSEESGRIDDVVAGVEDQASRITGIENNSASSVTEALRLDWLYKEGMKFALELFYESWTLLPGLTTVVTDAVAGDDSIDMDSTAGLVIGQEYAVFDDQNTESVLITEILTSTRARLAANLVHNYTNASLRRCSWSIPGGKATVRQGGVYYADGINMGDKDEDKAIIIRKDDNDTVMSVYYQDNAHEAWTAVPWEWSRVVEEGVVDVEYYIPARDIFKIKIVSTVGQDAPANIYHIAVTSGASGLEGTHHAPEQPVNNFPADGAGAVVETPTLAVLQYVSVVGSALVGSQVMVTTLPGNYSDPALLLDTGEVVPGALSYSVPAGILTENTTYYWRMRVRDIEGAWSPWSIETSFKTDISWEYVTTPVNQGPEAGAMDAPEQPTLSASAFSTDGFQLISLNDGTTDQWTNSTATSGEYYFSAAGPTHKPCRVLANGSPLSEGTLGALTDGEWAWGDQDTLGSNKIYVKLAVGDPDGQAAGYVQCGDSHSASQWQIRTATGDYTTPLYDSGESTDLQAHIVPAGILEDGTLDYYFRVRYEGENIGWSEWSLETRFTTKDVFANIIGVAMVAAGGGAGAWQCIDADGNDITTDAATFNNHPVWGGIEDVTIDSQAMVKIPKFYIKTGVIPVGDQAGKKGRWVSDQPADGFSLHPAFMDAGIEIDQFYYGKYEATNDGGTKAGSTAGVAPLVSIDFPTMQTRCTARNTGGVDGFHMANIHELSAVQLLCLIENGGPDVQSTIGTGNVSTSAAVNTGASNAVWRGIYELWGNVWCMIDGAQFDASNQIKVFDQQGNNTYVSTGVTVGAGSGWITGMRNDVGTGYDLGKMFLGRTTDGTESNGSFGDYQYAPNTSDNVCYHGGYWDNGSRAGLFYLNLNNVASHASTVIGSRLAKV